MPKHTRNRGNAGGAGGGRRSKKSAGGKPLGKVALAAITRNDKTVEDWIDDLAAGDVAEGTQMAKVIKQYGLEFDVQAPGEIPKRATIRNLYASKGAFKAPNATTKVRVGGWVIINRMFEEKNISHLTGGTVWQIIGIMTPEQSRRARGLMGVRATSGSNFGSSNLIEFNREMADKEEREAHEREIAAREQNLASLRRGRTQRKRTSSGRTARSSESNVSSDPNWEKLSEEKKAEAKHAKLTRRKERRRAKKAAGGSAWSWFSF